MQISCGIPDGLMLHVWKEYWDTVDDVEQLEPVQIPHVRMYILNIHMYMHV